MQRGQINSDNGGNAPRLNHAFLLRRLGTEPNCPSVQVDFSPPTSNITIESGIVAAHSHPTFNQDSCYFTPAFILGLDQDKYVNNSSSYLNLHESKKEELSTEKTDLFVPKPSKVSSFCCICRTAFEDYLTHVNIPIHQQSLRKSEFATSITQLCSLFNPTTVTAEPKKAPRKHSRKIQKGQKGRRGRKDQEATSSTSLKLDDCHEAKTRETLV